MLHEEVNNWFYDNKSNEYVIRSDDSGNKKVLWTALTTQRGSNVKSSLSTIAAINSTVSQNDCINKLDQIKLVHQNGSFYLILSRR